MTRSKTQYTIKSVKSYEKRLFKKYKEEFLDGDIDADLTREVFRTFGTIENFPDGGL